MASLPFNDRAPVRTLTAPSRLQLETARARLIANIRDGFRAMLTLAVAGVLGILLIEAWDLPATTILGLQEIIGVVVFATCTWIMYERSEMKLRLYSFEPADHTMVGEIRALLNRLPDGAAYQAAVSADPRAYTTGELEAIRDRARDFTPVL